MALQLQQVQQLAAATNPAALTGLGLSPTQGLPLFPPPAGSSGAPVTAANHQHHPQALSGNGSNGVNSHVQNAAVAAATAAPPITMATAGANQSAAAPTSGPAISLCNGSAAALSAALAANQQNNMALAAAALVAGAGLNGKNMKYCRNRSNEYLRSFLLQFKTIGSSAKCFRENHQG